MKQNNISTGPAEAHLPVALLRRYQADALPPQEQHQVERHLLECELCTDLLAGLAYNPELKTRAATQEINRRITALLANKKKTTVPLSYTQKSWGVAAVILLLLVSFAVVIFYNLKQVTPAKISAPVASSVPVAKEPPVLKPADLPVQNNIPADSIKIASAAIASNKSNLALRQPETDASRFQPRNEEIASVPENKNQLLTESTGYTRTADDTLLFNTPADSGKVAATATATAPALAKRSSAPQARMQTEAKVGEKIITGQVLEENGLGIPGVSVIVKGTSLGVSTDSQGKFTLTLPENQSRVTLVYSFIGFETVEKTLTDTQLAMADVKLKPDAQQLSEIAVVSYGSQGRKNVTIKETKAKPLTGMRAFKNYVQNNLVYPADARAKKVQGRVIVGFTVNLDGSLSDLKIIKSLSPSCDAEALRLVQEGPEWEPTRFNDKPVVQQVQVAIRFRLPKNN